MTVNKKIIDKKIKKHLKLNKKNLKLNKKHPKLNKKHLLRIMLFLSVIMSTVLILILFVIKNMQDDGSILPLTNEITKEITKEIVMENEKNLIQTNEEILLKVENNKTLDSEFENKSNEELTKEEIKKSNNITYYLIGGGVVIVILTGVALYYFGYISIDLDALLSSIKNNNFYVHQSPLDKNVNKQTFPIFENKIEIEEKLETPETSDGESTKLLDSNGFTDDDSYSSDSFDFYATDQFNDDENHAENFQVASDNKLNEEQQSNEELISLRGVEFTLAELHLCEYWFETGDYDWTNKSPLYQILYKVYLDYYYDGF